MSSLGPEHAGSGDPAYDRMTRREWINPYSRPAIRTVQSPIVEHVAAISKRVLGHVLISGQLFRAPEQRTSKAGKPYVTATIRACDGDSAQWWKVAAFPENIQAEIRCIFPTAL